MGTEVISLAKGSVVDKFLSVSSPRNKIKYNRNKTTTEEK